MLRRISCPLIQASRSSFFLTQASHCLTALEEFSTDVAKPVKGGNFFKEKPQFIAFVLGGPGSGKGTQCTRIVETYGFTHLSAGDLLRNEIESNSTTSASILEIIKEGKIVPSEVTVKLIQKAISSGKNDKFLIDGFPRTEENRMAYEQTSYLPSLDDATQTAQKYLPLVKFIGAPPNLVLFFDCPEDEMVKRVLNRNEGRVDDNVETIKKRLQVFRDFSLPVVNYYSKKGILHKINAVGTEDEIFEQVRAVFSLYEPMLKIK